MIPERVQKMMDNPGVYVCTTRGAPFHAIVIFSSGGILTVMSKDRVLDPERFAPDMSVAHGPLLPYA